MSKRCACDPVNATPRSKSEPLWKYGRLKMSDELKCPKCGSWWIRQDERCKVCEAQREAEEDHNDR